jgi:hypothetical protein
MINSWTCLRLVLDLPDSWQHQKTIHLTMSKLNRKLFKNKMTESKKSTEDIPGYPELKVEVRGGEEYSV